MSLLHNHQKAWTAWISAVVGLVLGFASIIAIPEHSFFINSATMINNGPSGERWACPMMDFIGTKPGSCPVCGMALAKVSAGEITRQQAQRMGVQLVTVEEGPAITTIHAYGAARYDDRTEQLIISRVAGRVVKRYPGALHAGLTVQVGDPLIDLYSPEVFTAQSELAAAISLGDKKLIAAITERFTRWNLSHVASAITRGDAPTDTITIVSPYTGRVIMNGDMGKEGLIKIGTEIAPDKTLLVVVDPTSYMVVIHVPEPRARLVREGQRVVIGSDDAGELPDVSASVTWIAPELNPEIRAREIHLHLRDSHNRLLPGSLINARIKSVLGPDLLPADPDDSSTWGHFPLIPASAVLSTGVRHIAWKISGVEEDGRQHFSIAPLALGQRLEDENGNDRYLVRAGLAAGDRVAAQGAFLIDSQAQLAGSPSLLFPLGAAAPSPAHQH